MSDWENLDDDKIVIKKANGQDDEEEKVVAVDLEKEVKPQIETKSANPEKQAKKNQTKEFDRKTNERRVKFEDAFGLPDRKAEKPTYNQKKQGELLSKESDARNTYDLFEGISAEYQANLGILEKTPLQTETDAKNLAKKIATTLSKQVGAHLNNQEFLKLMVKEFCVELLNEIYPKLTSKELNDILTKVKVLFNNKDKEEKDKEKSKKNKTAKPSVNVGKSAKVITGKTYDDDDDDDDDDYQYDSKYKDDDFM